MKNGKPPKENVSWETTNIFKKGIGRGETQQQSRLI